MHQIKKINVLANSGIKFFTMFTGKYQLMKSGRSFIHECNIISILRYDEGARWFLAWRIWWFIDSTIFDGNISHSSIIFKIYFDQTNR